MAESKTPRSSRSKSSKSSTPRSRVVFADHYRDFEDTLHVCLSCVHAEWKTTPVKPNIEEYMFCEACHDDKILVIRGEIISAQVLISEAAWQKLKKKKTTKK